MKSVEFDTYVRLGCSCGSEVIFCVDEDLTAAGVPYLTGTIVSIDSYIDSQGRTVYRYVFSFDDGLLADPNYTLLTCDITGAFCKNCLTEWVESLIPVVPEGNFWNLLGNSGTVDGTNFLGTIDNVPFTERVNNTRTKRTVAAPKGMFVDTWGDPAYYEGGPTFINGGSANFIDIGSTGSAILSGGSVDYPNRITSFDSPITLNEGEFNLICGGDLIRIEGYNQEWALTENVICGGVLNQITNLVSMHSTDVYPVPPEAERFQIYENFIGGGGQNFILGLGGNSVVTGGDQNVVEELADLITEPNVYIQDHYAAFLGGGIGNTVWGGQGSGVCCGMNCGVVRSGSCVVCSGLVNTIGSMVAPPVAEYDFYDDNAITDIIGAGQFNHIELAASSGIFCGEDNSIDGADDSRNPIFRKDSCAILGGWFNKISTNPSDSASIWGESSILGGIALHVGARTCGVQFGQSLVNLANPAYPTQTDLTAFYDIFYIGDADLWIGNVGNSARKIKWFEPNTSVTYTGTNYSSFEAQAQGANIEYKLPASAGVPGQVLKIQGVVGTVVTLEWANDLT